MTATLRKEAEITILLRRRDYLQQVLSQSGDSIMQEGVAPDSDLAYLTTKDASEVARVRAVLQQRLLSTEKALKVKNKAIPDFNEQHPAFLAANCEGICSSIIDTLNDLISGHHAVYSQRIVRRSTMMIGHIYIYIYIYIYIIILDGLLLYFFFVV